MMNLNLKTPDGIIEAYEWLAEEVVAEPRRLPHHNLLGLLQTLNGSSTLVVSMKLEADELRVRAGQDPQNDMLTLRRKAERIAELEKFIKKNLKQKEGIR
jgi:hypothetical protein